MARVLVIGAYGLIGREVTQALLARGHAVRGLGRSEAAARRAFAELDWQFGDLRQMQEARDWQEALRGVDGVVNCAGALQDGPSDDLAAVHHGAVAALAEGCEKANARLVQISAVGVQEHANLPFMTTKAQGDAAIKASGCDYIIFRPALVIAQEAYGGTALLRMLAAMPFVQLQAMGGAEVQTVAASDLAEAVCKAVEGELPRGFECDLLEEDSHALSEIVTRTRSWLGFSDAFATFDLPRWMARAVSAGADALGCLGWRGPLRSAAMETLEHGVTGDASVWRAAGQAPLKTLDQTYASLHAGAAERMAARMALLMPLAVATLVLFWALSGVIGLLTLSAAADVLTAAGWGVGLAKASVAFWALVDIGLAALLLWRRTARLACLLMVAVAALYLAMGTLVTPWLWADPLGPMVKILPAMMLAALSAQLVSAR